LEAFLHERSKTAAKNCLLAEEIAFGFLFEGGLKNAGASCADTIRIAESQFVRLAGCVLVNGDQSGNSAAFGVHAANQVAGSFGRDHDNINICGRDDGFEMNAEAVGEREHFALRESWPDVLLEEVRLGLVGGKNLEPIGFLGGLGWRQNGEAIRFSLGGAATARIQTNNDVVTAVAEVLGLGVSLAAVAE